MRVQMKKPVLLSKRYRFLQTKLQHFWSRWTREYLPGLARRCKWATARPPLKINDVCYITEDNKPRLSWLLGRVIDCVPGKDGLIRTYKLQTKSGVLTRPVQRLHLLEPSECDVLFDTHS